MYIFIYIYIYTYICTYTYTYMRIEDLQGVLDKFFVGSDGAPPKAALVFIFSKRYSILFMKNMLYVCMFQ